MKVILAGNSVYCDAGPNEGKHRVQATVYLSSEELALLQQNYGAEIIVLADTRKTVGGDVPSNDPDPRCPLALRRDQCCFDPRCGEVIHD